MRAVIAHGLRRLADRLAPVAVDRDLSATLRALAKYVEKVSADSAETSDELPDLREAGIERQAIPTLTGCHACDSIVAVYDHPVVPSFVSYMALCGHAFVVDDRGVPLCSFHDAYRSAP